MTARVESRLLSAGLGPEQVAALPPVLAVIGGLPREWFVPPALKEQAYDDRPLPIGYDQTISDPAVVALMTAALHVRPGADILEVGTGSGYQAAVLARLGAHVSSIEIIPQLAKAAARRLRAHGFRAVQVKSGDGFDGWPARAPFDAIIVTAGAAQIPAPLVAQLRPGGIIVMPIGPSWAQEQIVKATKRADATLDRCTFGFIMFVPLTGKGMRPQGSQGLSDPLPPCA